MKLAIITGASSGIGKATAKIFLENGYEIYNLSRSKCDLAKVKNFQIDLSKYLAQDCLADISNNIKSAEQVCLIHNAAALKKDDVMTCSADNLRDICEVNIVGPQKLNSIFLPLMPKGSAVIYVGSTLSEKAVAGAFTYVTTKHAQAGMMRATCQDLKGKEIHTALVCPGFTETEMLKAHLNNDSELLQTVGANNAFQRLIQPDEIAELIYFAANTPVINGSVLHGNLGQLES